LYLEVEGKAIELRVCSAKAYITCIIFSDTLKTKSTRLGILCGSEVDFDILKEIHVIKIPLAFNQLLSREVLAGEYIQLPS
jgi:hypothetical protein